MSLELAENVDVEKLDTAKPLAVVFAPYQTTLEKWEAKVASLKVTKLDQKTEMAQARLARLEIKQARVDVDKKRKELVEHLKARTSTIDTFARVIREKCESLEQQLLESEQFADRHAEFEKANLKAKRECEINPFLTAPIAGDLSDLTDEQYASTLFNAKAGFEARKAETARLIAENEAKVEAARLERERIQQENERLRKEAAERDKLIRQERKNAEEERQRLQNLADIEREKINIEREAIGSKVRAERLKSEKLQAEIDAKRAADEKALKAQQAADRKARNAPDAQKLKAMATTILGMAGTLQDKDLNTRVTTQLTVFSNWLLNTAESL